MKKVIKRAGLLLFAFILSGIPTVLFTTYKVSAAADTCTWTGASSGSLSDGANWSGCDNAGVPEAGDDLIFPSGPSQLNVTVDSSAQFNSVTVSGAGYTFSSSTLHIVDNLDINANNVTFGSSVRFYMTDGGSQLHVASAATDTVFNGNVLLFNALGDFTFDIDGQLTTVGQINGTVEDVFKTGSGKIIVDATSNNYLSDSSGSTNISDGEWQCMTNNCFGDTGNFVNLSGAATISTDTGDSVVISNYLFINPSTSRVVLSVGQELVTLGTITMQHDAEIETQASGSFNPIGDIVLADYSLTLSGAAATGPTATFVAVDSAVSGNAAGRLIFEACDCSMSGSSTFDSDVLVTNSADLQVTGADSLGTTTGKTTVNSNSSIEFSLGSDVTLMENLELSSNGISGAGGIVKSDDSNLELGGSLVFGASSSIFNKSTCPSANSLTISGVISGTGLLTTGATTSPCSVTISGGSSNTWSGGLTHVSGFVILQKDSAVPGNITLAPDGATSETVVQVSSLPSNAITGTATFSGTTTSDTYYDFQNNESLTNFSSAGASRIMVCQGSTVTLNQIIDATFAGTFGSSSGCAGSGSRVVAKEGTGTLRLTGSDALDTITSFQVNEGGLQVDGNFSGVNVSVGNALLKGIGSLGAVSLGSGADFNAGNSPGCITLGSLNVASGATFTAEIAGSTACTGFDQTTVTGAANITAAILDIELSYVPAVGTAFTILSAGSLTGTFSGLADGATMTINGLPFRISYSATSVTITRISTPASNPVSDTTLTSTGSGTGMVNVLAVIMLSASVLLARRPRRLASKK